MSNDPTQTDGFIQINLEEVPDTVPQLEAGTYTMRIDKAYIKPSKNLEKPSNNLVLELHVEDETNPSHGRRMTHYNNLGSSDFAKVGLRRIVKSAGLQPSSTGLNPTDLIGKFVKVLVVQQPYSDPTTGEAGVRANIKEFLF